MEILNNKIGIVSPYFGKLPDYFEMTVLSMASNTDIDWFVITDDKSVSSNFKNVRIIYQSFEEMRKVIFDKLGTKINRVYKLCDYKPCYRVIFDDILKSYDFWGYCDLDIVFGDLSQIFNDYNLKKYDKLLFQGHLSIYRNVDNINLAFKQTKKYKPMNCEYYDLLNHEYICVFDERYGNSEGINGILQNSGYTVLYDNSLIGDIDFMRKNFFVLNHKKCSNVYFKFENGKLYCYKKNGDLIFTPIYIHLQKRKNYKCFSFGETSYITPKGIFNREPTANDFFVFDFWLFSYFRYRITRKITNKKAIKWSKQHCNSVLYF